MLPKIPEWGFGRAMKLWALRRGSPEPGFDAGCLLPSQPAKWGVQQRTRWQAKQEHDPAILDKPKKLPEKDYF